MRIDLTHIKRIVEHVSVQFPDDPELLSDMLEGETDLHELARMILGKIEDEDGIILSLRSQIEARYSRKARAEARKKVLRGVLLDLLNAANQPKLTLPEATISRSVRKPKPVVTNIDDLPDDYVIIETNRKPDMDAIKNADELPEGVAMDNGGESVTVRMK